MLDRLDHDRNQDTVTTIYFSNKSPRESLHGALIPIYGLSRVLEGKFAFGIGITVEVNFEISATAVWSWIKRLPCLAINDSLLVRAEQQQPTNSWLIFAKYIELACLILTLLYGNFPLTSGGCGDCDLRGTYRPRQKMRFILVDDDTQLIRDIIIHQRVSMSDVCLNHFIEMGISADSNGRVIVEDSNLTNKHFKFRQSGVFIRFIPNNRLWHGTLECEFFR